MKSSLALRLPGNRMPRAGWIGAGLALLALACRIPWALQPRTVRWDEPDYLILARNLLRGEGYHIFNVPDLVWPPGTPGTAVIAMTLGAPDGAALAWVHVVAGALTCVLLFGLARAVTQRDDVAALAGVLVALSPSLTVGPLYWGSLSESPAMSATLAGLWATWQWLKSGKAKPALVAALAFGVGYLMRPEGVIWWLLILPIGAGITLFRRYSGRGVAVFALAFILSAAPYWIYIYQHTGRFMLSGQMGITVTLGAQVTETGSGLGHDYAAKLDSAGQEILWLSPEQFETSLLDSWRADPRGAARRIILNLGRAVEVLTGDLLGWPLVALIALGFLGQNWSRTRWIEEGFWLMGLAPLGVAIFFHVQPRLLAPALPILFVWAGRGLVALCAWGRASLSHWRGLRPLAVAWPGLVIGGVLVASLWGQANLAADGQASQMPSREVAGLWLAEHSAADARIMARDTEIGFYADRQLVPFPNASWAEVYAYGQARGADYLVVDNWSITDLRPQLTALLDPAQAPDELEHLITFVGPRRTTIIYRING